MGVAAVGGRRFRGWWGLLQVSEFLPRCAVFAASEALLRSVG